METTEIMFALIIAITIILIILSWVMASFIDKTKRMLKDIKDNQFDAQQVMNLYAMKYAPKPQIITENHDVVPLYAYYELPDWAEKNVTEDEIKKYLVDELTKQISDYMEVEKDRDIVRMYTKFRARLQVIDMLNGTTTYKN